MKKNLIYMAAALMLVGCAKEAVNEVSQPAGGEPIRFEAEASSGRTVVGTTDQGALTMAWADGDQIGIYVNLDDMPASGNVAYTANPNDGDRTKCTFSVTELSEAIYWHPEYKQSFYAYYPYNEVAEDNKNAGAHIAVLEAAQEGEANSPAFVGDYCAMTAQPFEVAANVAQGNVSLNFTTAYSIVEFRLKTTEDCPMAELPVKAMTLTAKQTPLAGAVALDLTQSPAAVTVRSGEQRVSLNLAQTVGLKRDEYTSFYMVVLPGTHAADALELEVVAIDNSKQKVTIADGVTFKPNKHYVQPCELTFDGFQLEQPFEVELPALEVKVGEPFAVQFKGAAESINFWSGEKGHDYAYANQDRVDIASMMVNFKAAIQAGGNWREPMSLKYSTDYNGGGTEADLLAATWTDISDRFTWPSKLWGVDVVNGAKLGNFSASTTPEDSGTVDCSDAFENAPEGVYFAFFYYVKEGTNRSYFYLVDNTVTAVWPNGQIDKLYEPYYTVENPGKLTAKVIHKAATDTNPIPTFIVGSDFASNDESNVLTNFTHNTYSSVVRFGAKYNGRTVDKHSYLVLPKIERPAAQNLGKDKPIVIQSADAETPASWNYTFTEPGTYKVYIISTIMTLLGEQEVIEEVTVTVTA